MLYSIGTASGLCGGRYCACTLLGGQGMSGDKGARNSVIARLSFESESNFVCVDSRSVTMCKLYLRFIFLFFSRVARSGAARVVRSWALVVLPSVPFSRHMQDIHCVY